MWRLICPISVSYTHLDVYKRQALAHEAPCEDVVKSDMALITLDTPVEFGSPNDPVSVLLCLGCTDTEMCIRDRASSC